MILEEEVTPKVRYLDFKGHKISLFLQDDGTYKDAVGTVYPALLFDPGYCGILPLETGKGDPWQKIFCYNHDKDFNLAKAGYADSTKDNLETLKEATVNIGSGMLAGAYLFLSGPLYWLVGGVGGFLLQQARESMK